MHVFLLDIPRLEFAALIPKGDYVTLCLLGDDIDEALIDRFFNAREVRERFPGGVIPGHVCHCYPRINIRAATPVYGDRLVFIGDSGSTRLFKDGIGAAYRTSKAAAKTAIFHGVSAEDFEGAWNSFEVGQKLRVAQDLARRYSIASVPAIVVNGKYRTGGAEAGSYGTLLEVIDELIARESAR